MIEPLIPVLGTSNPLGHVIDRPLITSPDGAIWYVSNVTVMLALATVVTMLIVIPAARRIATGKGRTVDDMRARGALANFVEAVCLYLRDEIFRPILGDQTDKSMPMLWTFFWFILVCNALGLVPLVDVTGGLFGLNHGHGIGGTATQSIWVTSALAVTAFLYWNINGLIKDTKGYFAHLTQGAPWYIWPIIVPVEILGTFIKPFALALRLFANMTGGHVLLAALFGFVLSLFKAFGVLGLGIGLIPLLGAVAIFMLEILVAFLQAFIFTFLTGLFLGQLVVHHHEEHEEHSAAVEH